jgi:hypothetical protein
MLSDRISRRNAVIVAAVAVPVVAAGAWLTVDGTTESTPATPLTPSSNSAASGAAADWGTVATSLPSDRTVLLVAPKAEDGAERILTVNDETAVVDFSRERPDTKYDLIGGGQNWVGLNQIGPAEDGNYQLVSGRDSEDGDVDCVSVNSAGQFSEEACEEVEGPDGIVVGGRDSFHFERQGDGWVVEVSGGHLEARGRQAGVTKSGTPMKFTVVVAP